ncbi:hypothetical protein COCOR_04136 [Corallococcus coralloides DSM 2259]|uniref:Uncharacterized protein n=1 Tax=Corallococcus coralloides (strain ATCC 25202 / DSM 2259 / NBRC 100086 / M2) TaxID=1144275 RepID=H8MXC9_CORCM|nr:hypothetical protein [Corallococcus coralloides]AFE05654.1 hypothetical protein COCOR_04136 [Corallococcus coralloides DSM 2259]
MAGGQHATAGLGPDDIAELEAIGSEPGYDVFLVPARALEGAVEECRSNIALAFHNTKRGVESVLAREAEVAALPGVNVEELRELPLLAQGLAWAALRVQRDMRASSFGTLFDRAQQLRRKLLKTAEALAEASFLTAADVTAAHGEGHRDVVGDCLGLVALFRRHEEKLAGRSPVTPEDVNEVERVAQQLRALLAAPGEARDDGNSPLLFEATETRDRFWTLLTRRHDVLWRCGAWLFGRDVDMHVPPLLARHPLVRAVEPTSIERAKQQQTPAKRGATPIDYAPDSNVRSKVRFMVKVGFDFPSR